jgi:hypothetical protein
MAARDYALNVGGISGSSPQVSAQGFAPEVLKLAGQLTRQRAQAGIGTPHTSPGIMQRLFDVIQRPLYASANTVDYAVKGKNPLMGTFKGLAGQDKTSYDQVLGDMGMSGGWQRSLLGFGADIALDPTTYLGAGIEKNVAEGVARRAGIEASAEAIEKEAGANIVKREAAKALDQGAHIEQIETEASKAARLKHYQEFQIPEGMSEDAAYRQMTKTAPEAQYTNVVTNDLSKKEAKQVGQEVARGNALSKVQENVDKELAAQRGKVYLKFMGKQTPIASESLYRVGRAAADVTKDLPIIKGFNAAFRPGYNLPQGLNTIKRNVESLGIHLGEQKLQKLAGNLHGLSPGEGENVMRAISAGRPIEGTAEATGRPLQEYADLLKNEVQHTWDNEAELGLRGRAAQLASRDSSLPRPPNFRENYVPMILRGGTPEERAAFKKGVRQGLPGHTIEDAEAKGLKPVLNPNEAYGYKIIKSGRITDPANVNRAAAKEFGVTIDDLAPGTVKKKIGRGLADNLGLKPYKLPGFETPTTYFPPEIGDALKQSFRQSVDPAAGGDLLRYFDKVQNAWKLNMTAVNPGHHIRNFAGDVWLNHMDGLHNVKRYEDSAKVLKNWSDNPDSFKMMVGDVPVNSSQLMDLFTRNGGKSGFFRQEYAQTAKGFQGFARHPVETIRQAAEKREDWTRMAHFLDVMDKGGVKGIKASTWDDVENIAKEAGQRVRKFNIDYGDLTPFERNFMKRVVPFYTWMRKNIPLQLETMAMDPGKISVMPKGLRALQNITGQDPNQSVFGLNTVPQWLREMAGVRIAGEGIGRNQLYFNPSIIPSSDIGQYFNAQNPLDVLRTFGASVTPVVRMPIEQATGRMLNSGAPVGQMSNYLDQNIAPPSLSAAASLLPFRVNTPVASFGGKGEPQDIAKLLGITLYPVGPQQQLGELRRQQDPIQALLKARKTKRPRSWESGYGQPTKP